MCVLLVFLRFLMQKILILLIFLFPLSIWGQGDYARFDKSANDKLFINLSNYDFFKNVEYDSEFLTQGYTIGGYNLKPTLMYYSNEKVRLEVGANILQYWGLDDLMKLEPTLTAHIRFSENLQFIFGSLDRNDNHKIISPLYNPEMIMRNPVENGFQFLFDFKYLEADLWADWENYISYGDSTQEKFNFGVSSDLKIIDNSKFRIKIPLQMIARHHGGEISDYEEKVLSHFNNSFGISIEYKFRKYLESLSLSGHKLAYSDLNDNRIYFDAENGQATYAIFTAKTENSKLSFSYFYADDFFAYKGQPIFQCYDLHSLEYERTRELFSLDYRYKIDLGDGMNMSFLVEGYHDLQKDTNGYAFMIDFYFAKSFFLKEIK